MRIVPLVLITLLLNIHGLPADQEWHGENKARLDRLIDTPHPENPVAVFDWDNTVIKNDIGDAVFFWMVSHDLIRRPATWRATSPFLSKAAVRELDRVCPLTLPGPLPTSSNLVCADTILSIYARGFLNNGTTKAWQNNFDPDLIDPAYAWATQMMAGYQPDQIREIASRVIQWNLQNKVGTRQRIGSGDYAAYLRIYLPMKRLISKLKENGFDVWIVSASTQFIVEPFARQVGIPPDHVIGIRPLLDVEGRITSNFQGCGNETTITYRKGKRCWINKEIFGVTNPREQTDKPSPIIFGAGDSDTDLFFLRDSKYKLVINRNKQELMCHAYANQDGNWLINPMFIEPKLRNRDGYSCRRFGLPDQKDLVFF